MLQPTLICTLCTKCIWGQNHACLQNMHRQEFHLGSMDQLSQVSIYKSSHNQKGNTVEPHYNEHKNTFFLYPIFVNVFVNVNV